MMDSFVVAEDARDEFEEKSGPSSILMAPDEEDDVLVVVDQADGKKVNDENGRRPQKVSQGPMARSPPPGPLLPSSAAVSSGVLAPSSSSRDRSISSWNARVRRQRRILMCCNRIEHDVHHVISQTAFLQADVEPFLRVAKFARHEIVVGPVVGTGGFSVVSAVSEIRLDPAVSVTLSLPQVEARQRMVVECCGMSCAGTARRPKYVLKHLQESLGREMLEAKDPSRFVGAAVDLILESEYLQRLDHPNVAKLRGVPLLPLAQPFRDDSSKEGRSSYNYDSVFLLLEAVDETLEDVIQREMLENHVHSPGHEYALDDDSSSLHPHHQQRRPSSLSSLLDHKLSVGIQLATALSYLHSHGLLFRDLKPHNVGLVRSENDSDLSPLRVVLLDFGLCRQLPSCSGSQGRDTNQNRCDIQHQPFLRGVYHMSAVGTRRYMAVEVVNNSRYNQLADVYSLGIVLWEYLVGKRAFASYSIAQHSLHVCVQGERPPTVSLPLEIRRLLAQCWTDDLEGRMSADDVTVLLTSILRSRQYDREISRSSSLEKSRISLGSCDEGMAESPLVKNGQDEAEWDEAMLLTVSSTDEIERFRRCQHPSYLLAESPFPTENCTVVAHPVSPISRLGQSSSSSSMSTSLWPLLEEDHLGGKFGGGSDTVRTGSSMTATTHSLSLDDGDAQDARSPQGIALLLPPMSSHPIKRMTNRIPRPYLNPFHDDDHEGHHDEDGTTVLSSDLTLMSCRSSSSLSSPPRIDDDRLAPRFRDS
jgi:serine/threonine protein kinase